MITKKALQQALAGAQEAEEEGPCFCVDEECEFGHEEGAVPATHVITYVTSDGRLDTAENKEVLGPRWGYDADLDGVLDFPQNWPEDAPRMVVIERETGQWYPATAYL